MLRLVLCLFLCGCSFFKTNDAILRVGDLSFTEQYFADRLLEKLKNVDGLHIKNTELITLFSQQLEKELIEEGFLFSWAKQKKLTVSSSEIAAYLGHKGTDSTGMPTDFIFEAAPAKNLLENHVRLQIIKNHFFADLEKTLLVSDEEIAEEYKKKSPLMSTASARVQQILLSKQDDAQAVLTKIITGSSFDEMAKKFSLSPEGASGGHLGWQEASISNQAKWLSQQPIGLVRKPMAGPGGFYLYKILEVKKPATQSLIAVKETLRRDLLNKKKDTAYLQWLETQTKTVKVSTNERLIHTITSHYQETL
jgi:peptidyl-prolyl cis-trans isomerase C